MLIQQDSGQPEYNLSPSSYQDSIDILNELAAKHDK